MQENDGADLPSVRTFAKLQSRPLTIQSKSNWPEYINALGYCDQECHTNATVKRTPES